MQIDLFEFETTEEGGGEPAPAEPVAETPLAEPEPEPEAPWSGPSQEEWEQTQRQLAEANELVNYLRTPQYPQQPQEQDQLPDYDPLDPEAAAQYFDARDKRLLAEFREMLSPVVDREQNAAAREWAEQTFGQLGVPEADHWREGVLFTSAGFQQFDDQGRPLVHPQQAASAGYEFLKRFAAAERAAEREAVLKEQQTQDDALRQRVESSEVPAGSAGVEGIPAGLDELSAARMWRERQAASG